MGTWKGFGCASLESLFTTHVHRHHFAVQGNIEQFLTIPPPAGLGAPSREINVLLPPPEGAGKAWTWTSAYRTHPIRMRSNDYQGRIGLVAQ